MAREEAILCFHSILPGQNSADTSSYKAAKGVGETAVRVSGSQQIKNIFLDFVILLAFKNGKLFPSSIEVNTCYQKKKSGEGVGGWETSLAVQRLRLPPQGAQVRFLVRGLRSHLPRSAAKTKQLVSKHLLSHLILIQILFLNKGPQASGPPQAEAAAPGLVSLLYRREAGHGQRPHRQVPP